MGSSIKKYCAIALILLQILIDFHAVAGYWGQHYYTSSTVARSSLVMATPTPTPDYYGCYYYQVDYTPDRYVHNHQRGYRTDRLTNAWIRFKLWGSDARIATACPYRYGNLHACGTQFGGWMQGYHPSIYDGPQRRTLCFSDYSCRCKSRREIQVQNCGNYYIYRFYYGFDSQSGICTDTDAVLSSMLMSSAIMHSSVVSSAVFSEAMSPSPSSSLGIAKTTQFFTPSPNLNPCFNHSILSETSRYVHGQFVGDKCDNGLKGWYRFALNGQYANMATSSPFNTSSQGACGSRLGVWLLESHPSKHDGERYRKVCFSGNNSVNCLAHDWVKVKNCGQYYVYRIHGIANCPARYCSEIDDTKAVQILTSENGVIRSPNRGSGKYGNKEHIEYYIRPAHRNISSRYISRRYIKLNFVYINLESGYDFLRIYREMGAGKHEMLSELSGDSVQFSMVVKANAVLNFTSDNSTTFKGFLIYYDTVNPRKLFTLSCLADGMAVKIDRDEHFNLLALFRDRNCNVSISSSKIDGSTLYTNYGACGTSQNETSSEIRYQNDVDMFVTFKRQNTSDYIGTTTFSCQLKKRTHVVSKGHQVTKEIVDFKEDVIYAPVGFRMYRDRYYRNPYSSRDFPVTVKENQILYFELKMSLNTAGSRLVVDRCYVSSSNETRRGKSTDVIRNGCPVESSTSILSLRSKVQFQFPAKVQLRLQSVKFIHCDVITCPSHSRDFMCYPSCQRVTYGQIQPRVGRQKRDIGFLSELSHKYTLSQGPLAIGETK